MTTPDVAAAAKEFREWMEAELTLLATCPRCEIIAWFPDGRCSMCGMERWQEGPAPRRILRGLGDLL